MVTHGLNGAGTCTFGVTKKGRSYRVEWVANDRTNQELICKFSVTTRLGDSDIPDAASNASWSARSTGPTSRR